MCAHCVRMCVVVWRVFLQLVWAQACYYSSDNGINGCELGISAVLPLPTHPRIN